MSLSLKQTSLALLLFIISTIPCGADDQKEDDAIKVVTDFTYIMGDKDSKEKSRALAFFGAKLKAVNLAAKYLTHKGVLEHYEKKQSEIFCLTTNEIQVSIIDERFQKNKIHIMSRFNLRSQALISLRLKSKTLSSKKMNQVFRTARKWSSPSQRRSIQEKNYHGHTDTSGRSSGEFLSST